MSAKNQATACFRSLGLELGGAHSHRSSLVVLDHYPQSNRLIVKTVINEIGPSTEQKGDELLIKTIQDFTHDAKITSLATQAPIHLPPFFKSASAREQEIKWLEKIWRRTKPQPRPFLPYLNRPTEVWMRYFTPEKFNMSEALGSNMAPLTARLQYLKKDFPFSIHETYPKASVSRILQSLNFNKKWSRNYFDLEEGVKTRERILEALMERFSEIFIYDGDLEILILDLPSFNALFSALTQHLQHQKQCEVPPEGFPSSANFVLLPRQSIEWDKIL